jgi:hypothetical protein
MVTAVNQNGDKHYFYPKAKSEQDALSKGTQKAISVSNYWNTWVVIGAELFNIKLHARD